MNDFLRNATVIPSDWTADDAVLVAGFLEEIIDTIWLVHGDGMERVLYKRNLRQCVLELDQVDAECHP